MILAHTDDCSPWAPSWESDVTTITVKTFLTIEPVLNASLMKDSILVLVLGPPLESGDNLKVLRFFNLSGSPLVFSSFGGTLPCHNFCQIGLLENPLGADWRGRRDLPDVLEPSIQPTGTTRVISICRFLSSPFQRESMPPATTSGSGRLASPTSHHRSPRLTLTVIADILHPGKHPAASHWPHLA